jgi:hypothetical protein
MKKLKKKNFLELKYLLCLLQSASSPYSFFITSMAIIFFLNNFYNLFNFKLSSCFRIKFWEYIWIFS